MVLAIYIFNKPWQQTVHIPCEMGQGRGGEGNTIFTSFANHLQSQACLQHAFPGASIPSGRAVPGIQLACHQFQSLGPPIKWPA